MSSDYISNQVQRTLRVIKVMVGHEITGISPKQIATTAKISATDVTRTIANLEAQSFVERMPNNDKLVRLSAAFVQISNTVAMNLAQAQKQLQQDQHNYTCLA